MKKQILILLIASCSTVYGQRNQEPYQTKTLGSETINNVEVRTSGGSISVTGVPQSQARIEVYVRGNNGSNSLTKEEIRQRLEENYNLNISVANNKLVAEASPKLKNMNWKRSLSISFKVFVPEKVSTHLRTSGGSISLANLTGSQDFSTSGGSLRISDVSGQINGRTSGGSIHASGSKGDIDLSTSGGSLDLAGLSGTIKANTSGGSIKANNIAGELRAHTSGGSVRMTDLACSLDAGTSGGQINVSIRELGKYVKLGNSGGDINLQIPAQQGVNLEIKGNRVSTSTLKNFNGRMEKDEIEGTLNGGGVPVTVRGGSGHVTLSIN